MSTSLSVFQRTLHLFEDMTNMVKAAKDIKLIRLFLTEKVLRYYFRIHNILVHTISHAEGCHKCDLQPVRGLFHLFEQLLPLADILRVGFLDNVRTDGELHLTKVDNVVSTGNEQVITIILLPAMKSKTFLRFIFKNFIDKVRLVRTFPVPDGASRLALFFFSADNCRRVHLYAN